MPLRLKERWRELERLPPGRRFRITHRRAREDRPRWRRPVFIAAALVATAIGIVLAFIPGPAVVFFALAAALASTESLWVARLLDRTEMRFRKLLAWFRRRRLGGKGAPHPIR